MDCSHDKLFSGTRLTQDKDRGICGRHHLNLFDVMLQCRALTDNFAKCPNRTPNCVVSPDCVPDYLQKIFVFKRLGQKVQGSSLDCSDRHRDVAMTSEKDNRDL